MAIRVRKSSDRGASDLGWLFSRFTFSFAGYHDAAHMGVRSLRVINEDRVAPGTGFGRHPHSNFEIFSYVLDGTLKHGDSMGNTEDLTHHDVQFTSAGRGISHSEMNGGDGDVRFLQVWLKPHTRGLPPSYASKRFDRDAKLNKLCPILSGDGRGGSIVMNADARVYATLLEDGAEVRTAVDAGRSVYVHVAQQPGSNGVELNGVKLEAGDGAYVTDVDEVVLKGHAEGGSVSEVLVFDLA